MRQWLKRRHRLSPALTGRSAMERKEYQMKKLQARRGAKITSSSHPVDTGYERLLTLEEVSKIIPDWILDQRAPTATEWESSVWLSEVIRHQSSRFKTRGDESYRPSCLPPWATTLHDWPMGPMASTQGKRRMEAPPSPSSLTTLF